MRRCTRTCIRTSNVPPTHSHILNRPHKWLYSDITVLPTQQAEIESPIYCGATGPELLMRGNLNEHPACYLCSHQAVSRFTLRKYYIITGPIHYACTARAILQHIYKHKAPVSLCEHIKHLLSDSMAVLIRNVCTFHTSAQQQYLLFSRLFSHLPWDFY